MWDIVTAAVTERVRTRRGPARMLLAAVLFALAEVGAVAAGVTVNILWAPTTPIRAWALVVTLAPPVWAVAATVRDRYAESPGV